MPRPFPLISGNFDDPPASDSYHDTAGQIVRSILNSDQTSDEISPSGELYRRIEQAYGRTRAANRAGAELHDLHAMASEQDPERMRRIQRETQENSQSFTLYPTSPPARDRPPRIGMMASRRGRARISMGERYLERHRAVLGEGSSSSTSSSNGLTDLDHAGRQLQQASSTLRALLDDPVPNLSSPTLEPESPNDAGESRRAKRRRLDPDRADAAFKTINYGYYGQVEPGKLNMEIVSCDGGIFQDHQNDANCSDYSSENVLRNDTSVYCTKSNRCNLVLRHQGGTVFSLKELVIRAPQRGYTAPVQEGMVFVSMTSDDLLARTARYQIQYSPPRPRQSGAASQRSNELPPIISLRHNDNMTEAQARTRRLYNIGLEDEECEHRTAQIPADFQENAPQFQVTTECSDSEGDDDPNPIRRRPLHRSISIRFEDSDSGEEGTAPYNAWLGDGSSGASRTRRRATASNITLAEAAEASQIATLEAVRAVGGGLMAPHARFFIERDKSKCTVRFDPPVSGRFILLKMWSPDHSSTSNIDIQSVVAKGFAGPRYFPAVSMR